MVKMTVEQALLKGKFHQKKGELDQARVLYKTVIEAFPNNKRAKLALASLDQSKTSVAPAVPNPSKEQLDSLIALYSAGRYQDVILEGTTLVEEFSSSFVIWNILGAAYKAVGLLERAADAFAKAGEVNANYPEAHHNLGIVLKDQGKLDHAIAAFERALALKPDYASAYYNMGNALKDQGKRDEAVAAYERALALKPHYADAYYNMGVTLQEQGKLDEAVAAYERALALKPDYATAYNNMGNALKVQGKLDEAVAAYERALALKPDYADAYNNMGVTVKEQGRFIDAVAAFERALALKPDYATAYNNMGNALKDQGKLDEAVAAYECALALKPDYADAYSNMGNAVKEQGRFNDAAAAYERALALKPDYADAWSNGAVLLEKWNKLKELGLWLERACQTLEPIPSDIIFMKAKLLWRNKHAKEAIKLISSIDFETIRPERKIDYFNLKAKCHDASKDYDLAFTCFGHMNSLVIKSNDYLNLKPQEYFDYIIDRLAILNSKSLENPVNYTTDQPDVVPVFLVGFPRSGTTLLDTILRSHSSIEVVEEQPAVASAKAFVKKSGYSDIEDVLPEKVIAGARKAYITELNKHRETVDKNSVLIDKLPLNLLDVPVIQQLYPQAKFILALRYPLDTILSCWMQNFKLNNAMANMVDLDRIVDFYCVAMDTFRICRAKYNLNVHEIRYEDLLEDLSGETSALLKFLDLDWEAQMENFPETALKRGRINTPSYSQVVQPIYKDAKYKWLNYKKHLEQYFIKVEPWINEFNYTTPRKLL